MKVTAFRLNPANNLCPYSIDGERYNADHPINAVVLPKTLKVFAL
jgi:hypothetical protein